jgi:hypothetical protein
MKNYIFVWYILMMPLAWVGLFVPSLSPATIYAAKWLYGISAAAAWASALWLVANPHRIPYIRDVSKEQRICGQQRLNVLFGELVIFAGFALQQTALVLILIAATSAASLFVDWLVYKKAE